MTTRQLIRQRRSEMRVQDADLLSMIQARRDADVAAKMSFTKSLRRMGR